jgi:glycolate dehydrogenase FAD-linked subunit
LIDIDRDLERIVGQDGLVRDPRLRMVYECDGYTLDRSVPERVVLPHTIDELERVVKLAGRERGSRGERSPRRARW